MENEIIKIYLQIIDQMLWPSIKWKLHIVNALLLIGNWKFICQHSSTRKYTAIYVIKLSYSEIIQLEKRVAERQNISAL